MYWNKFFIIFSKKIEKSFNFFSGLLPLSGSRLAAELQKHKNGNPGMGIHHIIKPSMRFNEEKDSLSNVGVAMVVG